MKTDFDLAWVFVRKADGDHRAMELLIDASGPTEVICFHAQQCAEKMLKALIVSSGLIPSWTHDLIRLLDELTPHHPTLSISRADLVALNPYAVQSRYDMRVDPGLPEALEACARAQTIREAIAAILVTILPDEQIVGGEGR